jgi:ATP-dependent Clp protease ATP-binding subunit ClpA
LKRAIQTYIQNPLAVKLLQGEIQPGQVIKLSASGDNIEFKQGSVVAAA